MRVTPGCQRLGDTKAIYLYFKTNALYNSPLETPNVDENTLEDYKE